MKDFSSILTRLLGLCSKGRENCRPNKSWLCLVTQGGYRDLKLFDQLLEFCDVKLPTETNNLHIPGMIENFCNYEFDIPYDRLRETVEKLIDLGYDINQREDH